MNKINFQNGVTKVNADTFNTFQNNIEKSAVIVSKNEPTTNEKVWFQKGKNLLRGIIPGYEFSNSQSGDTNVNENWFVTEFVPVEGGKPYYVQGFSNNTRWWFDENKNFISFSIENPSTAPSNAKYIRLNGEISSSSNMMISQGDTEAIYEPYIEPKIFIKNSNGIYEEFVQEYGEEYYTEERKIGTWLGKPLYRKVIINNGPFVKGEQVFNNGIANVDKIINVYGMARRNDGKDQPLTTTYFNSSVWNVSIFDVSNTQYSLMLGENQVELYQITQLEIIFEYTKTAD